MQELFGVPEQLAIPDLPNHINELYQRLKHFDVKRPEALIKGHTLFRYYTAFVPETVQHEVFQTMLKGHKKGSLHLQTGIMPSTVSDFRYFRYCPDCIEEDIQLVGEPYWHLQHQIPSYLVCTKHYKPLQNSRVLYRPRNRHAYHAAHKSMLNSGFKARFNDYLSHHLLAISRETDFLIQNDLHFSRNVLQRSYTNLLQQKGYITPLGSVRQKDLSREFINYYGSELLDLFQSSIKPFEEKCWLKAITRKHRKSLHPIRHLLFIRFLGESVQTLHKQTNRLNHPFGEGPYPCLNAASDHFRKSVIDQVQITYCSKTKKPVGTFSCECGFIYSRRGPDQSPKDSYRVGRIKQFGSIWFQKLHHLIRERKYSYREIARQLNVDTNTVIKYSKFQGCVLNRSERLTIDPSVKKSQWQQLKNKYPQLSTTELRQKEPGLYAWLYRHDRDWLKQNSSSYVKKRKIPKRIDWKQRDEEILDETIKASIDLLIVSKPSRLTVSKIGKAINRLALLEKHLSKMTKTQFFILDIKEATIDFQKRRICWAVESLLDQGEEIREWKVKRLAGLKREIPEELQSVITEQVEKHNSFKRGV